MLIINGKIFTMTGKPVDCGYKNRRRGYYRGGNNVFPGQET